MSEKRSEGDTAGMEDNGCFVNGIAHIGKGCACVFKLLATMILDFIACMNNILMLYNTLLVIPMRQGNFKQNL